jgi:hypothetical protein
MRRYLERGNPADTEVFEQIPRLINLAERAIAEKLKVQGFLINVTSTLDTGVSVYPKPNRWRETVSMNFGTLATPTSVTKNKRKFLLPRGYEYCRTYWPDSEAQGLPLFYADYNYSWWLIVPTPVEVYPWQINYYQLPPLLDDTTQTNWLTNYAPNLLLYRCLLEATPFLKNDERIPVWQGMYQEQLDTIDQQDLQKVADREAVRSKA